MLLKFIGKNGSMGLIYGKTYDVKIISRYHYILVKWDSCKVCPYSSPQSFAENWTKPESSPTGHNGVYAVGKEKNICESSGVVNAKRIAEAVERTKKYVRK